MSNEQPQEARNPAQVLEQAKNARALYHHVEWTLKLLGHAPENIPPGDYTLMLRVVRHTDGNVSIPQYCLEQNINEEEGNGEQT